MGNDISRRSGNYMQTSTRFFLLANEPTYQQFQRLFKEDCTVEEKWDGFGFIRQSISSLQEIVLEVFRCIRENEKELAKDPDMKELVREYIDISLDTSRFYCGLGESLRVAKAKQHIIGKELQIILAPGRTPLSEGQVNKVREKMREFSNDVDPFKDLHLQYEPLLERHEQARKNIEVKIKELGRRRRVKKVWRIFSGIIWAALAALAAVTCYVVVAVAPSGPGLAMAGTLFSASIERLAGFIVSFRKEDKRIDKKDEILQRMDKYISVTIHEMKQITGSVERGLNRFKRPMELYIENYLTNDAGHVLDLREKAEEIKMMQEPLIQNLDDLCQDVDRCIEELHKQRAGLMWA